jgi:glutamate-ammonia-ligase adenylyltransferase
MNNGQDLSVRTSDTAAALDALNAAGYLSRAHYETLRDGYLFLRRLEQRIHISHGTSSTLIDEHGPGLSQLARRMGLRDAPGVPARALLLTRYRDVTSAVRRTYLEILGRRDE